MKRDFLGMNGKDSGQLVKEESGGSSRQDGAFGGSFLQWPFSNKVSAMQQYISYKAAEGDKQKNNAFDQFSSGFQPKSTEDAYEAAKKTSPTLLSQKSFSLDRQVIHQFPMHRNQVQTSEAISNSPHQLNETRTFPVVSHHSIPVATSSPFFKVHGAQSGPNITVTSLKQQPFGAGNAVSSPVIGSVVSAFPSRNAPKPTPMTAQLTIFYAGSVNVYDNVPLDKAQAIMLLASKGSNPGSKPVTPRTEVPLQPTAPFPTKVSASDGLISKPILNPTPIRMASPCSGIPSPISVSSHMGANSGSGSSTNDDTGAPKAVTPPSPPSQQEPPKTVAAGLCSTTPAAIMPRAVPQALSAVPQARKASLARFLEKRKERVTNAMPYSCNKTSESGVGFGSPNLSSISSSADVNISSNREDSWCFKQQKSSIDSREPPNTKLEI